MNEILVITLVGPDRSGIVAQIAGVVAEFEGNWLESRLLHMGGQFAGAIKVEIESNYAASAKEALEGLKSSGLHLTVTLGQKREKENRRKSVFTLSGQDQPGIVKRVFQIFQRYGINVEELETGIRGAPWSGHALFEAEAKLSIPDSVEVEKVLSELETISHDLLVEIDFVG